MSDWILMCLLILYQLPAVDRNGSGVWGVAGFYPSEEGQEGSGMFRYPLIWPCCKLELANLPFLTTPTLYIETTQFSIIYNYRIIHLVHNKCTNHNIQHNLIQTTHPIGSKPQQNQINLNLFNMLPIQHVKNYKLKKNFTG